MNWPSWYTFTLAASIETYGEELHPKQGAQPITVISQDLLHFEMSQALGAGKNIRSLWSQLGLPSNQCECTGFPALYPSNIG